MTLHPFSSRLLNYKRTKFQIVVIFLPFFSFSFGEHKQNTSNQTTAEKLKQLQQKQHQNLKAKKSIKKKSNSITYVTTWTLTMDHEECKSITHLNNTW